MSLQTNLTNMYNQSLGQLNNPQGGGGQPSLAGMVQGGGQPQMTAQPLRQIQPDLSGILQKSPGFQFQQQEGEKAINRALAARGLGGSSQAVADIGKFNQRLMADEYGNIINRLSSMADVGLGGQPSQMGQYGPSLAASSNQLASMPQANLSELYNQAAVRRGSTITDQGTGLANLYTRFGNAQAQNLAGMGQASTFALPQQFSALKPVQGPNPWVYGVNALKDVYGEYKASQKPKESSWWPF